jgi:methyl-accepting chemotaxis protein
MWKHLSLSARMAVIGIIPTLCFVGGLVWLHSNIRAAHYESRRASLRQLVEGAWNTVDYYGAQVRAGKLSEEQAKDSAKQAVRSMRYGAGEGDYFWINDLYPRMVMNTAFPALEGKDLTEMKDPKGIYIFQAMVRVSREKGAGPLDYMWKRKGSDTFSPKINFVKLYEPWGWVIGTGAYVDDVETELRHLGWILLGVSILGGGLSLFLTVQVVRSIGQSIRTISAELGDAANQVSSASAQVAQSSQTLARDSAAQAASLEETSAAGEEISSMARRNAENSQGSTDHMTRTSEMVEGANRRLGEMTVSMKEIRGSSDQIAKIIKVIDGIAFQTNILALNAAVEAARAGEAGLGFAVVADEVRTLAQRSAQAAHDTTKLIEESISRTREGAAKLDAVAESMKGITASAASVRSLVDQVHSGSQEQARGIEQVSQALANMEQLTQRSAAGAEESAAAGAQLSAQANGMRRSVEQLDELVNGASY